MDALQQQLQDSISAANLTEFAAEIVAASSLAIDIALVEPSAPEVGTSRFGGTPDLPRSIVWPRDGEGLALAFLLQINLAESPSLPMDSPWKKELPDDGMLYFFIGLDEPATDVAHQVFIYSGSESLEPATSPAEGEWIDDAYWNLPSRKLEFRLRADTPHWSTNDYDELTEPMNDDQQNAMEMLGRGGKEVIGQLLGHTSGIGQDPREDAYVVQDVNSQWLYNYPERNKLDMANAKKWRNLLRLDSVTELDFCVWDAGYFNFLIHEDQLANLDFSRLYVAVESS